MREMCAGGVAPVVETAEAPGHVVVIGSLRVQFFNPRQRGGCTLKLDMVMGGWQKKWIFGEKMNNEGVWREKGKGDRKREKLHHNH